MEKKHKFELGLKAFAAMDLKWDDIPKTLTGAIGSPVDFKEFDSISFIEKCWQATRVLKVVRFDDDLNYSKFAVIFDGTPVIMIERRIAVDEWITYLRRITVLDNAKMIGVTRYDELSGLLPEEAAVFEDVMIAAYEHEMSGWQLQKEEHLTRHLTNKLRGYLHGRIIR